MFKRILLTAVLGAGLLLSVPFSAAQADHRGGDRDRRDWGVRFGGPWGYYPGDAPLLVGVGDSFNDDYFVTYGYRCNGYRDGYYGNRYCDEYYYRHGYRGGHYPYGYESCDEYDYRSGYCWNG